MTTDQGIHEHINALVAQEKALREQFAHGVVAQAVEKYLG